uniref:Uncharacterized protein n=1 Tax=Anguilla anguilla TaxID=7936 RepID=A0A0E9W4R6_ANGAN
MEIRFVDMVNLVGEWRGLGGESRASRVISNNAQCFTVVWQG